MFNIVLANFHIKNKLNKARFFQKTFLLTSININIILGKLFLTFNNVDIVFINLVFTWRYYTITKTLSIIKRIKLIKKKKFAKMLSDRKLKIFVMYIISLKALLAENTIHLIQKAQIAALK